MKHTLATLNTRVETLEGQNERLTKILEGLQLQIASMGQTAIIPPCDCGLVTCEECLSRAMGQFTAMPVQDAKDTSPKRPAKGSDAMPSKEDDLLTVVIPYMAKRVKHNIANSVECDTAQLTASHSGYGVKDFRFNLTRKERSVLKGSWLHNDVSAKDAVIALAGAVERVK